MHTYKLTTKCHLCAYLYALGLNMWDMGLAIHDSRGSPKGDNVTFFYHFFYIGAPLSQKLEEDSGLIIDFFLA